MIIVLFLGGIIFSVFFTLAVKKYAIHFKILDTPDNARKKHHRATPLLGGVAIWLSFWCIVGYLLFFTHTFTKSISNVQFLGIFLGSLLLMIVGFFDDVFSLSPWVRLIGTFLVSFLVVACGIQLLEITNPLGGVVNLEIWPIVLANTHIVIFLGDIVVFLWLIGMMYTTKILDGLDGLSTGVTTIGAFMIFFLTQTKKFYQPEVGILALVFAGCCIGFLLFNFSPAKIFLGEGGSLFLGFLLGILAVISGGKIATTLLVMAVPLLDIFRVIYLRIIKHRSIFHGDREHLHFRLLDAGLNERKSVLFLYAIAFIFGITTLFFPSKAKLFTLIFLMLSMFIISILLNKTKHSK